MGAFATANGLAIVAARLTVPRSGAWHGELVVDDGRELSGAIDVTFGGVVFAGTAVRSGVQEGAATTRLIGGNGGLARPMAAKAYADVPLSLPLKDILAAGEERMSSGCTPSVTGLQLRHWTILECTVSQALGTIVRLGAAKASWRVLLDGSVWVGEESWDGISVEHEVLLDDPVTDSAVFYMEKPTIIPGRTFLDRKVSYVEHTLTKESVARTTVMFEK